MMLLVIIIMVLVMVQADIDECNDQPSNGCSQMCRNTNGSYECYCNSGYTLDTSDNRLCVGNIITLCILYV